LQYRIRRFGIQSTALTVGVLYFLLAWILVPLFYLASRNGPPEQALPGIAFVLGPFIYAVIGYLGTAIGCWLYNLVAGWSGGISLTLEQEGAEG
jgi:4-hydroxybenzoate polyprenyltransferase